MAEEIKATERLARWAADAWNIQGIEPQYHDVRITQTFPPGMYRVQVVYGRWIDVGVGLSREEAMENAAEGVMDKIHEAKTPIIDWEKDALKQHKLLEKRLFKFTIDLKQFGLDTIHHLFEKINENEAIFGRFESLDMYDETNELFVKLGLRMSHNSFEGDQGRALSVTIVSEEYPSLTVVEFANSEEENMLRCITQLLSVVQYRLEGEIKKLLEQRKKEIDEKKRRAIETRRRRYNGRRN